MNVRTVRRAAGHAAILLSVAAGTAVRAQDLRAQVEGLWVMPLTTHAIGGTSYELSGSDNYEPDGTYQARMTIRVRTPQGALDTVCLFNLDGRWTLKGRTLRHELLPSSVEALQTGRTPCPATPAVVALFFTNGVREEDVVAAKPGESLTTRRLDVADAVPEVHAHMLD